MTSSRGLLASMSRTHPLRIAFLVDNLTSEYPADLAAGVLRAARQMQARVLVIPGGELGVEPSHAVVRNFIYDWLAAAQVDGVVVAAGSLSNHVGPEHLREWLRAFAHIPCMAIGVALGSVPSVHVNNERGMYDLVDHLISAHSRRRIAFIGGPRTSVEAQAREQGYRRALAAHDVRIDDRLLISAHSLGREDGMAAVTELFEVRRLSPDTLDAIIGMNDEIALGVLEELHRRGILVPKAIAVAGFDNSAEARAANPPLSTVNQHVELQAFTATKALLDAIEKGEKPADVQLESEAIFRTSCGCTPTLANDSTALPAPHLRLAKTSRLALLERRTAISAELARAANGRLGGLPSWESRLLDALMKDLDSPQPGDFLREFELLVRQHMSRGHGTVGFHDVLTALRLQGLICATVEPNSRARIEDLFQECRLMLSRIGYDVEHTRHQNLAAHLRILWRASLSELGSGSGDDLGRVLDQHLPAIGIAAFCVSRFREGAAKGRELEVTWRRSARGASRPSHTLGLSDLGIDPALGAEAALVIEPLDFDGKPVGVAVFTWGALEVPHYAQLREMLGAAMFGLSRSQRP